MKSRAGVLYGIAAYTLWGIFPLYWPLLKPAGAGEVLAHRMAWSLVALALVVGIQRKWSRIRQLAARQVGLLTVAGLLISANWGVYIYGVNSGHIVETSLGYFINPLVTVALAVVLLGERLRPAQWCAVILGVVAVAVLSVDYGRLPWIALVLAVTFAGYGLLKKRAHVAPLESLTVEGLAQFAPAFAYIAYLQAVGTATFTTQGGRHTLLLMSAGIVSTIPLLFFGAAAIRVPLSTLGLLQYIGPVLQFAVGVFIAREDMPASRWVGFALVWLALAILVGSAARQGQHNRRARRDEARDQALPTAVG